MLCSFVNVLYTTIVFLSLSFLFYFTVGSFEGIGKNNGNQKEKKKKQVCFHLGVWENELLYLK